MPKNASESITIQLNVQECIRNLLRIKHDFSNRGIRGQVLNSSNFLIRLAYELQELTTDCMIQLLLRSSRTEYVSPRIQIFVNSWRFVGFGPCVE